MLFDGTYAVAAFPILLAAAAITVKATVLGFLLAAAAGLVLAILRLSPSRWLSLPATEFVELMRSTPVLIQIFYLYFVLPEFGVRLGALTAGVLALGLHYASYCAEVYRAGLENIPRGQWDAAVALNLGPWHTFKDVILPQAVPPVVPALGNYLIALFKETPLLSAIAVVELMQTAKILGSENFRYIEPMTMVGLFFLAFSLLAAALVRQVERRLGRSWRR